jgi:hypothetical protein
MIQSVLSIKYSLPWCIIILKNWNIKGKCYYYITETTNIETHLNLICSWFCSFRSLVAPRVEILGGQQSQIKSPINFGKNSYSCTDYYSSSPRVLKTLEYFFKNVMLIEVKS